jgi:hypothetical protein
VVIALLPTWDDKLSKSSWGIGPEVFTTANAAIYGRCLGARLSQSPHLVGVVDGDRSPVKSTADGGMAPFTGMAPF